MHDLRIILFSVSSNRYYFDEYGPPDTFAVGNDARLRLFPQSRGLSVPAYASRGKNAHIRGIKHGICRPPRIMLIRAGDGDHLGTAESRSMWAVFEC